MPGGNVCRSNQKRDRALKDGVKGAGRTTAEDVKRQAAVNSAIQCKVCMATFPRTVRKPELEQHFEKHAKTGKSFAEVFPDFSE